MRYKIKVKFPCGLEFEEEWRTILIDGKFGVGSLKEDGGCPLHGFKCKKNIK